MSTQEAKLAYCELVDRLLSSTCADGGETIRKSNSDVTSSSPKLVAFVDRSCVTDSTTERMQSIFLAKKDRQTTATAQVKAITQSILSKHLQNRSVILALALLACRAAIRQRNIVRAATFSFLAVCIARPELLASIGIKIEVDSNVLQAVLKDKFETLVPSKPVTAESDEVLEANKLVNSTEKDGWTVVASSEQETEDNLT